MPKSQSFKVMFLLFWGLAVTPKESFAFISPDTLQVVMASVGPGILYALIVVLAAGLSVLKKIKNRFSRKHVLIGSLASCMAIALIVGWKYHDIRSRTHVSYRCCHKDACDLEYCAELIAGQAPRSSYQEFRSQRYIDLNTIDETSYGSFQLLGIQDFYAIRLLGDRSPFAVRFDMNLPEMKKRLKRFDQSQKLLLYFTYSDYASLLAYTAFNLGYDAYYTSLRSLKSDRFLSHDLPLDQLTQILPEIQDFQTRPHLGDQTSPPE